MGHFSTKQMSLTVNPRLDNQSSMALAINPSIAIFHVPGGNLRPTELLDLFDINTCTSENTSKCLYIYIHIFEIMTPQRNIIGTVILWQFIRTRHMLMDDMKQAFARLNGAITGYIGNIPVIGGIWKLIVKSASWISKPPDVNAASSGSSRCTVM